MLCSNFSMLHLTGQTSCLKVILTNHNYVRFLRSVARRDIGPKTVEGKVKTVTQYDDSPSIESYKDFINNIKGTKLGDELEVEKEFLNDDYHGDAFERCDKFFEMHGSEEKSLRSSIKKKIIGRKYFKLEIETNLLTYAAKEQIRFLHKYNPLEWNCKALSEHFPVSENGVKKLLKSNFTLRSPERIKAHDEEVAERWKILKSGKPTNLISSLTQKLYKEGKLIDDCYSGNPKLPTVQPSKKVIDIRKKKVGEFSAIVQTYIEYEKQKLLTSGKETSGENQVSLRDSSSVELPKIKKNIRQYKYVSEENDNRDPEVYPYQRKQKIDSEIPFSQFKQILKDETSRKLNSKKKDEYDEFVMEQTSEREEQIATKKHVVPEDCFLKIPKYDKDMNVDVVCEKDKNALNMYKYDKKLGYQHPFGKIMKNKVNLPPSQKKKGKLHKIGQCVYDDDGEFLYKIPA